MQAACLSRVLSPGELRRSRDVVNGDNGVDVYTSSYAPSQTVVDVGAKFTSIDNTIRKSSPKVVMPSFSLGAYLPEGVQATQ